MFGEAKKRRTWSLRWSLQERQLACYLPEMGLRENFLSFNLSKEATRSIFILTKSLLLFISNKIKPSPLSATC